MMNIGMTKKELASVAGYTYRRLYDIDKGLPKEKKLFVESEDGKYDLALFVQRWVEYNVDNETESVEDLDVVKARHEAVKIRKTELEVKRMKGELVAVDDVKRLWGEIANTVMQSFIHLPATLAPMLLEIDNTERCAGIIDNEIRKILNQIAEAPVPDYAARRDEETEEAEDE